MENDLLLGYGGELLLLDGLDELLDFSKEEAQNILSSAQEGAAPPPWQTDSDHHNPSPISGDASFAVSAGDAFLCDDLDLAEMEWLSNFVEESFSPASVPVHGGARPTTVGAGNPAGGNLVGQVAAGSHEEEELLYLTDSPLSVLENNVGILVGRCSSSSSSFSISSPTSSTSCVSEFKTTEPRNKRTHVEPDPSTSSKKKLKIKLSPPAAVTEADVRKCLHCGIQKTPQWRAGPMGPKTLCNACGVRYKSGRLFPEYRPAASPTFVAAVHSNSHKKVVEMRMRSGEPRKEEGRAAKQVSSKCCELLNYIKDSKEWGAHEGRKDRGTALLNY